MSLKYDPSVPVPPKAVASGVGDGVAMVPNPSPKEAVVNSSSKSRSSATMKKYKVNPKLTHKSQISESSRLSSQVLKCKGSAQFSLSQRSSAVSVMKCTAQLK